MNDKDNDHIIKHLQWLIEQKQDNLKTLETRIIYILGINGIIHALIWVNIAGLADYGDYIDIALLYIYGLSSATQLVLLIHNELQRQPEYPLTPKKPLSEMIGHLEEYFETKSSTLEKQETIATL